MSARHWRIRDAKCTTKQVWLDKCSYRNARCNMETQKSLDGRIREYKDTIVCEVEKT